MSRKNDEKKISRDFLENKCTYMIEKIKYFGFLKQKIKDLHIVYN